MANEFKVKNGLIVNGDVVASGSSYATQFTSSNIPIGFFGTSSRAVSSSFSITASYASGSGVTAKSSSYSLTASYALNSSTGTTLGTGSTYPITSSWAQSSSVSVSSSYALTSSYALNSSTGTTLGTGSTYPITSSWAQSSSVSVSSSYALTSSYANAAGVDSNIQFNKTGTFSGSNNLTWNYTTNTLNIFGNTTCSAITSSKDSLKLSKNIVGFTPGYATFLGNYSASSAEGVFIGQNIGSSTFGVMSVIIGNNNALSASALTNTILIGENVGMKSIDLNNSVLIGTDCLSSNNLLDCYNNTCIGSSVLTNNPSSSVDNVLIGYNVLTNANLNGELSEISRNIIIGSRSGATINRNRGSNNIMIGYNIDLPNNSNHQLNIGNLIFATGSSFASGQILSTGMNVGIGTSTPQNRLTVEGNVSASTYTSSLSSGVGFLGTASFALNNQNIRSAQITFNWDGLNNVIETGSYGFVRIPYNGTVTGWTLLADTTCSFKVNVRKGTYSSYNADPGFFSLIDGTEIPYLSTSIKAQSSSLSTWTTNVSAGDIFSFTVTTSSLATKAYLYIDISTN